MKPKAAKATIAEDEVEQVLLRDVDRVLGAHHAGFEQQEADLHHQHQAGRHITQT